MSEDTARSLRRLIMHFTHVLNLPGILAAGRVQADNHVARRSALVRAVSVTLPPFGCTADYVPFYLPFKLARGRPHLR